MPDIRHILATIIIALIVCSCRESQNYQILRQADSVMEEYPDSALSIINTVNPEFLESSRDKAFYSLLKTQALVKNDYNVDSDSIINNAVSYYEKEGESKELMRTMFYQSWIKYYKNDYKSAMDYAMRAHDLANKYNDNYWIAKTAEFISSIFSSTYNPMEGIKYSQEAIKHYMKSNKIRNLRFVCCDLAVNYNMLHEPKKGIAILDSIISIAKTDPVDSMLLSYCYSYLPQMYVKCKEYKKAKEIINLHKNLGRYYYSGPKDLAIMAEIELNLNNPEVALNHLRNGDSISVDLADRAAILDKYVMYFKQKAMLDKALTYSDSVVKLQDNKVRDILKQSVTASQRDYYNDNAQKFKHKAHHLKKWISILIGILLLIVMVGIIMHRLRIKWKDLELSQRITDMQLLAAQMKLKENETFILNKNLHEKEENIGIYTDTISQQKHKIDSLSTELERNKSQAQSMSYEVERLYKSQWSTINMLCDEFFGNIGDRKVRDLILNNIENELTRLRDPKFFKEVEDSVNKYMDNIVCRLRSQCVFLKNDDILFLMLSYAGFSKRAVSLFTDIKLKYYYTKRSRLINKIEQSDAKDKQEFVNKLY